MLGKQIQKENENSSYYYGTQMVLPKLKYKFEVKQEKIDVKVDELSY